MSVKLEIIGKHKTGFSVEVNGVQHKVARGQTHLELATEAEAEALAAQYPKAFKLAVKIGQRPRIETPPTE